MTTASRHPLVEDYLTRLRAEAARLPADQARELVADIDEHVGAALGPASTEAEIRNVLERLGTPRELVTEAGGVPASPPSGQKSFASPSGAIICLVAAEILSLLLPLSVPLWILGLVMMARATMWSEREKLLGMLGLGTGLPFALVWLAVSTMAVSSCAQVYENGRLVDDTCGGVNWVAVIAWSLTLGYLALQVLTVWRLVRSMRRR